MSCNCRYCQIRKKSPEVQYAYLSGQIEIVEMILKTFEKQKIDFDFTKLDEGEKPNLNELGCVAFDINMGNNAGIDYLEKEYPELKQFWEKEEKMKENIPELLAENQRLKEQLDREVKINKKMKSCLGAFARRDNWKAIEGCADWLFLLDPLMAEETLKEIEEV